jgi:exonuclease SbcC
MRIVAIRGSNLASLKGDFAVELDQPPLSSLGLFAIHGPVGAGKSTLLDALTLALFGRTPRLSGSGGAVLVRGDDDVDQLRANDPATLVRRGAASAHAEVDFIGRDGRLYRARWDIRRGRGVKGRPGRLQDVKQRLKDVVDDAVLGDGNSEVRRLIEERLGLSFDELCRSVLLAQGGFQGFLTAKPAERAELLEKVTGTGIYSRLGAAAFDRARTYEQALEQLEARVGGAVVLDDGARAALEAEVVLHGNAAANADALAQALAHTLERAQAARALDDASLDERRAVAAAADAARVEQATRARRDEAARRLEALGPALVEHDRAVAACAAPRARLQQAMATASAAAAAVADARLRLDAAARARAGAGARYDEARREVDAVRAAADASPDDGDDVTGRLQARLAALQALQEARDACDGVAVVVRAAADDVARVATELGGLEQTLAAARAAAAAALPDGVDVADHAEAVGAVAAAVRDEVERALAGVDAEIAAREDVLQRLEAALQAATMRRALLAARATLRDGEPCPVCGSGTHPAGPRHPHHTADDDGEDGGVDAVVVAERATLRGLLETRAGLRARLASVAARAVRSTRPMALAMPAGLDAQLGLLARLDDASALVRRVADAEAACTRARATLDAARAAHAAQVVRQDAVGARLKSLRATLASADDDVVDGPPDALRGRIASVRATLERWGRVARALDAASSDVARCTEAWQGAVHDLERAEAEARASDAVVAVHRDAVEAADGDVARAVVVLKALGAGDDVSAFAAAVRADAEATQRAHDDAVGAARDADVAVAAARQRVLERSDRLERLGGPVGDDIAAAALPSRIDETRAAAARARDAAAAARARLALDEATRAERARLTAELERARAESEVWRALSSVIGSADGGRFRQFAQGLTLDALVAHANEHLQVLSPRYRLRRTKSDQHRHDLDLVVLDTECGDVRSTQTLSGGESFLVSLALALGLSSLSANEGARGRVESLFIDEGFSALDQETLDVALSAFDALRQTGRQIGVISHVPLLVERLGAQVRVVPMGGGASRVEIHAA